MDILTLAPMVGLAIVFIVLATQMWRKSISTAIHAVSGAIALYSYGACSAEVTLGVMIGGILINMARGVINTERDRFVKRECHHC